MLAIEIMVDEILRLQNLTMYLQAQLREAKMNELVITPVGMRVLLSIYDEMGSKAVRFPVIMEDELIHTDEHPFCDDPSCGCHYDLELLEPYIGEPLDNGLFTPEEATRFRYGKQL